MSRSLDKVADAAASAAASREALHLVIRDLHREGVSLRDLARVSGLSHETIRRIVKSQHDAG